MTATVRVTDVSEKATEKDLWDFFSFSGEIAFIELKKADDGPLQVAYVTFQEEKALDTATLLTGAVIVDHAITVEPAASYLLPSSAAGPSTPTQPQVTIPIPQKAQEVMADLLAKGYIVGKDALFKAKDFDNKHALSKSASIRARELDQNTGISNTISAGAATVNQQLATIDEKYQVMAKTKAAYSVAETKLNEASQQLLKNKTVASATGWLSSAFSSLSQTATNVQALASKKIEEAERATEQGRGQGLNSGEGSLGVHGQGMEAGAAGPSSSSSHPPPTGARQEEGGFYTQLPSDAPPPVHMSSSTPLQSNATPPVDVAPSTHVPAGPTAGM